MDIKSLQHAIALETAGHFSRAAEKVHLSQSALSRSIQSLEQEVGVKLFDRAASGVIPTPAGRHFLERARRLLSDAHSLKHEMGLLRDGGYGEVSFGAGPAPAATLLTKLLARITATQPGLAIRVEINNWHILKESLRRESIEFFLAGSTFTHDGDGLTLEPLSEIRSGGGFFCRKNHPLANRRTLDVADLAGYPLISTNLPHSVMKAFRQKFGIQPSGLGPFAVTCDNIFLLKQILHCSDAILFTAHEIMCEELADDHAVKLNLASPTSDNGVNWEIAVVTLNGRSLSPGARKLIEEIRTMLG